MAKVGSPVQTKKGVGRVIALAMALVMVLVLWEILAQGTRTWAKYGLLKQTQTLPSLSHFVSINVVGVFIIMLMVTVVVITVRTMKPGIFGVIRDLETITIILGPLGTGKTTVTKKIIEHIKRKKKMPIIVVDWKGEYEEFYGEEMITVYNLAGKPLSDRAAFAMQLLNKLLENEKEKLLIAEDIYGYLSTRRFELSYTEKLILEARTRGLKLILIAPDPEMLPSPLLKSANTIISMTPDSLPRFTLERALSRVDLREAQKVLKMLKKSYKHHLMVVYHRGELHFVRKPKPPKKKLPLVKGPKGDRVGT